MGDDDANRVAVFMAAAQADAAALQTVLRQQDVVDVDAAPLGADGNFPSELGLHRTQRGCTPLLAAIQAPASMAQRTTIVKLLLAAGADVTATDKRGQTALHHAAGSACAGCGQLVELLLQHGPVEKTALIDKVDKAKETALHVAARCGNADVVSTLIDRGAHLDFQSHKGDTPLILVRSDAAVPFDLQFELL